MNSVQKTKCILWDNDGVLVDTESLFLRATEISLAENMIEFDENLYRLVCLHHGVNFIEHIIENNRRSEAIVARRDSIYKDLLSNADLATPGLPQILKSLSYKYRLGVVTGSGLQSLKLQHSKAGLEGIFDFIITADDYCHPKPNPEPYLIAVRSFQVDTRDSIVIEDSPRGFDAAKQAGLNYLAFDRTGLEDRELAEALTNLVSSIEDYFSNI